MLTLGAAGKIGDNWTTMARGQWTRSKFNDLGGSSSNLTGALAYRPPNSDKYALLFSYNQRAIIQSGVEIRGVQQAAMRDRSDTLSTDALYQVNSGLEIYGRYAMRFNGNGDNTNLYVSSLTYSGQVRAQQRINNYLDIAAEGRWLAQPASGTRRTSVGAELGYWVISDLRFGAGYNFTGVREPAGPLGFGQRRGGFYFNITTKLSHLFNLFGTTDKSLVGTNETGKQDEKKEEPK